LSSLAESLSRELALAERELLRRRDLQPELGLPKALLKQFARLDEPTPGVARVMRFDFHFTDEGWRKLTLRWALFFLALALVNEIVWRTQTTDFWVNFKVFGVVPLTFIFAALQYPLLQRYAATEKKD